MRSIALLPYLRWHTSLLIPPLYHLAAFGLPQPSLLDLIGRSEWHPVDRLDMIPEVVQVIELFVLAVRVVAPYRLAAQLTTLTFLQVVIVEVVVSDSSPAVLKRPLL